MTIAGLNTAAGSSTPTATRSTQASSPRSKLNGTDTAAVSMMTGLSGAELDDLAGMPQ
ncbi:MAG: hypothetical protein QM650_17585 [Microlunatus sp.]